MTFYSILEERRAAYIFRSKGQMLAAAEWMEQMDGSVKHYKSPAPRGSVKRELMGQGYQILEPIKANEVDALAYGASFFLPYPGWRASFYSKPFSL